MNILLWTIYEIIITAVQSLLVIDFLFKFNGNRLKSVNKQLTRIGCVALFSATTIFFNFMYGDYEGELLFASLAELSLLSLIIFDNPIIDKLFGCVCAITSIICVNYPIIMFSSLFFNNINILFETSNIHRFISLGAAQLLLFFIYKMILFFKGKNNLNLSLFEWLSFIVIFLACIVGVTFTISMSLTENLTYNSGIYLYIIAVSLIIITLFSFYMIIRLNRSNIIKMEGERIKNLKISEYSYTENILAEFDHIKILKHDMKNVLAVISALAEKGKYIEISKTLVKYKAEIEKVETYININNPLLNALLNLKISKAKEAGIDVSFIIIENITGFEELDICFLLGNILDNAVESCMQCEHPEIKIRVECTEVQLEVIIKNSVLPNLSNPHFETTKKEKEGHGFGIKSMREIARKYNGTIDLYNKNGMFVTSVTLIKQ